VERVAASLVMRAAPEAPVTPRARLEWLDFYRGLAVLVMIETHVCNTFLFTAHWPVEWRVNLNYVNGLVAPAFLFIAGYAHGLGLRRKRAVRAHIGPRLVRLVGIAAIGYAMHFPVMEVLGGRWADALRVGSRLDVLACLALGIAALVLIERACDRWVKVGVAVALAAVLIAAPLAVEWTAGPVALVAMLNQSTGSLFPLLPWVAFTFAGFLVSEQTPSVGRFLGRALAAAVAVILMGRANLTPVSAVFFFERLAWILALVPVCAWLSSRCAPSLVLFAGRESLSMYIVHLALIEIIALSGLARVGLPATAVVLVVVLAGSYGLAHGWRLFSVARADRVRRAAHLRESSARAA
jgi:uncharacterized membrane protein